jgi:hypothetical protein
MSPPKQPSGEQEQFDPSESMQQIQPGTSSQAPTASDGKGSKNSLQSQESSVKCPQLIASQKQLPLFGHVGSASHIEIAVPAACFSSFGSGQLPVASSPAPRLHVQPRKPSGEQTMVELSSLPLQAPLNAPRIMNTEARSLLQRIILESYGGRCCHATPKRVL